VVGSRLLFGLPTHLYFHRISRSLFLLDQEWEESSHVIIFLYLIIKKRGTFPLNMVAIKLAFSLP
jgi:hypothetical protein